MKSQYRFFIVFAGILALILSWLVFLIPVRDFFFIELSIGAVFAGNKYFVILQQPVALFY